MTNKDYGFRNDDMLVGTGGESWPPPSDVYTRSIETGHVIGDKVVPHVDGIVCPTAAGPATYAYSCVILFLDLIGAVEFWLQASFKDLAGYVRAAAIKLADGLTGRWFLNSTCVHLRARWA